MTERDEENLFLSNQHPASGRYAVFEDDGETGYLYSCDAAQAILGRCWIYNRKEAPEPRSFLFLSRKTSAGSGSATR
jgi:hypothetical protein